MSIVWYFVALVVLIALSAFFSASEMSYSSANRLRLENAAEDGDRRAKTAVGILDHFDRTLSAILIGNNLVNIAASSLGSVIVILLAGEQWTWVSTVVLTLLVIIFGETMPKIVAKQNANGIALRNAYIIRALSVILYPVIWLVVGLVHLITRPLHGDAGDGDPEEAASQELQSIIETAEDEDVLDEDRSELLRSALDFSDISASEAMTARVDMVAIDIDDDWDEIVRIINDSSYSRLPVYSGSVDNIIGFLYLNRFFKAMMDGRPDDLRAQLIPPCFVYKTTRLPDVLAKLRREQKHLAVVTDEYGGTLGVITMEDVLEELVGDIWDEKDVVENEVVTRPDGGYELDGAMTLSDFLELLDWNEDALDDADSTTVGGWTLERFGTFPKVGDSFRYENLTVTVLAMDGRRVEPAQEVNGLEVFPAAEAVGLELLPIIVQVQHGRDGIHPQSVHVELLHPVVGVGEQEGHDLRSPDVKAAGAPAAVFLPRRFRVLIGRLAVKAVQPVGVLREVRRHPVQQHADPRAVQDIHKGAEIVRGAVARGRCVVAAYLIPPRPVEGVLHDRHQLDVRIPHLLEVGGKLIRQLALAEVGPVWAAHPRSEMYLIDIYRVPAPGCGMAASLRQPSAVVPRVGFAPGKDCGCPGRRLHGLPVRVCLDIEIPVPFEYEVLI